MLILGYEQETFHNPHSAYEFIPFGDNFCSGLLD